MHTYQAKIGYARTSTVEQNLDAQIAALKAAGCGMVRTEQKSGTSLEGRPELKTILDFIHPGETLVVTRIDRLARSLSDLQTIATHLKSKGAHLAATEQPVDTSTATGKAFFDMLGVFAKPRALPPRSSVARIVGGFPRSIWPPSKRNCRRAFLLRKSPATWGSRAEPSIKQRPK